MNKRDRLRHHRRRPQGVRFRCRYPHARKGDALGRKRADVARLRRSQESYQGVSRHAPSCVQSRRARHRRWQRSGSHERLRGSPWMEPRSSSQGRRSRGPGTSSPAHLRGSRAPARASSASLFAWPTLAHLTARAHLRRTWRWDRSRRSSMVIHYFFPAERNPVARGRCPRRTRIDSNVDWVMRFYEVRSGRACRLRT